MTVAIVHYHLGLGGVSQVIITISHLLREAGIQHVILVGANPPPTASGLPIRIVPVLEYDVAGESGPISEASLMDSLRTAALEALGVSPDIWHFHNHSLGKNRRIPQVVENLAEAGERILLQIHDLAEDGRPDNYARLMERNPSVVYPVAERIHYAFLNSRDRQAFTMAGLPLRNSSVLANPIVSAGTTPTSNAEAAVIFAPIRGIRRKNIGELVLLAALAPPGTRFAISQAPLDPTAKGIHDTWRRFASHQRIPIDFNVVGNLVPSGALESTFESWVRRSTHWISTSVSEGFGLTFLEAIAHRKPLIGRRISYVSDDHAEHGIVAGNLYDRLLIPEDWVDLFLLKDQLLTTLERNYRLYRKHLTKEVLDQTLDTLVDDGWLDFGNLPESLQQSAIERSMETGSRNMLKVEVNGVRQEMAEWLNHAIAHRQCTADPRQLTPWSPESVRIGLCAIYQQLMEMSTGPLSSIEPASVLEQYFGTDRFHFLKSAPKPATPPLAYRAVIFDIYGTLLIAPAGGVKVDLDADTRLRSVINEFGFHAPDSPSTAIHDVVRKHHIAANAAGNLYPEVDLRDSWREALGLDEGTPTHELVVAIEAVWHPAALMPGAMATIQSLAASGLSLGILSNAQCNTRDAFGDLWSLFAPALTVLSYQHGIAKPSDRLFQMIMERLARRGIHPSETLFIGNDPLHDVVPAANHGFRTALFAGHPDSYRPGACVPDHIIRNWSDIHAIIQPASR
jgi:FMN phosphatase YigB (HAD superfamily)